MIYIVFHFHTCVTPDTGAVESNSEHSTRKKMRARDKYNLVMQNLNFTLVLHHFRRGEIKIIKCTFSMLDYNWKN